MKIRNLALALSACALAASSFAASADILFTNLGNVAPPASIGGHTLTPFDQAPQTAIADGAQVSVIPGAPSGGSLGIGPAATKLTRGITWGGSAWAGGYNGALYFSNSGATETLTLPAGTQAFYFYVESNYYTTSFTYTAVTNSGATSTPVVVAGGGGGHGFAFHSTAGESITSITITGEGLNGGGFAVGQFGAKTGPTTTCASEGYTGTKLEWCKNICERDYSGSTLNMWIRRWIDRYRILPYCGLAPQQQPG
jgi:hypothetical protein